MSIIKVEYKLAKYALTLAWLMGLLLCAWFGATNDMNKIWRYGLAAVTAALSAVVLSAALEWIRDKEFQQDNTPIHLDSKAEWIAKNGAFLRVGPEGKVGDIQIRNSEADGFATPFDLNGEIKRFDLMNFMAKAPGQPAIPGYIRIEHGEFSSSLPPKIGPIQPLGNQNVIKNLDGSFTKTYDFIIDENLSVDIAVAILCNSLIGFDAIVNGIRPRIVNAPDMGGRKIWIIYGATGNVSMKVNIKSENDKVDIGIDPKITKQN